MTDLKVLAQGGVASDRRGHVELAMLAIAAALVGFWAVLALLWAALL